MRRFNPSWAALALATAAVFAALGGPAWAAGLINGSEIKNGTITSKKIGRGQVETVNLAGGAVTGSKVAPGTLTAGDVAPNTFLAANGTAANSNELGGVPPSGYLAANGTAANSSELGGVAPSGYLAANGTAANSDELGGTPASGFVQGTGNMVQHSLEIPVGTSDQFLLDVGLGEIDASCVKGSNPPATPEVTFTAEVAPLTFVESGLTAGGAPDVNSLNGLTVGSSYTEPNPAAAVQAIDFRVAQSSAIGSSRSRVATIWTSDQAVTGTDCIFTAQAVTTGV